MVAALDLLLARGGHSVATQVVEAELAVGPVGDIHRVLLTPHIRWLIVLDNSDGQPKEVVELPHPLRVAASEVIVNRYKVCAAASQRVQIKRQGRNQRLTFASGHFSNPTPMQYHSADELDIEV